jgi:chaperonin GroEL
MDKVGKDGVITVEEGKSLDTTVDLVEGMQFDKGYLSPHFVNRPRTMDLRMLEKPYILIHEKKLGNDQGPGPAAREDRPVGRPLLIVAEDVEGEALATLVVNKLRGTLQGLRGQGPRLRRSPQGHARGHRRPDRRPRRSSRISASRSRTSPQRSRRGQEGPHRQRTHDDHRRGGQGRRHQGRIEQIKAEIDGTTSDYDREKLEERLAKLSGGVAQINVGAATEAEMKEKKARVEDALHACARPSKRASCRAAASRRFGPWPHSMP